MAFAYKPRRNGQPTEKWYARYRDYERGGKWRSRAGSIDRRATEAMARRLEVESARRAEGLPAPPAEGDARRRPVAELVAEFAASVRHAGRTEGWAAELHRRLNRVAVGLGWATAADLARPEAAGRLARWLAEQRATLPDFGARTSNAHLSAVRQFARWLVRSHTIPGHRFGDVSPQNERADPRRPRRVLTPDEFRRLVAAAEASRSGAGANLTGVQRAVLYVVAAYTGLRASELASLTPASFSLDADPPTVTVEAKGEKARRGATLPLHTEVVTRLRTYLPGVPAGARLWPGPWAAAKSAARMLRVDLKAAGIPYRDAQGRQADLHSLRSYFVTQMAIAGVPPMVAQKLSRHSTLELMRIYARVSDQGLAEAVNRLPPV